MKKTYILLSFFAMIFLAFCFCVPKTDDLDDQKLKTIIKNVRNTLTYLHYKSATIDDKFSEEVFDTYLESLDPSKRYLLSSDVELFKKDYHNLDDYFTNEDLTFYKTTVDTVYKRIEEVEGYAKEILEVPFDFTTKESLTLELKEYPKTKAEAKEVWKRFLKYNTLVELMSLQEDSVNIKKGTPLIELELEARKEVKDIMLDYFRRMKQRKKSTYFTLYMNAFTSQYDPHTSYFSPTGKEDFDLQMSGQLEGIGAKLQDKRGYATIDELVVGGPAWKSNKLEVGDQIIKVAQGKKAEPVNIVGMLLEEAVRLIRGKKGTQVILTVKKKDGSTEELSLIRDVIEYDEIFARSAIIEDEKGDKYGIIYLPEFYTNLNDANGRDPSDDVLKEINELKKQDIKGLVFDIRNNGGGSLEEVVEISGLFIKNGPIVQVKRSDGVMKVHEDRDNAIYYDGPLVIMVNELSASASEIMAAAMQDYGRAVIVGSKKTFGKGSVQTFLPLDNKSFNTDEYGALKLTIQMFYRVDGSSTQLKGVHSDVVLPDQMSSYSEFSEDAKPHALPWDQINKLKIERWTNPIDLKAIKAKSEHRLAGSEYLELINKSAEYIKSMDDVKSIPLNIDQYKTQRTERKEKTKEFEALDKYDNNLKFNSTPKDILESKKDTVLATRRNNWHKSLKKDFYIQESVNVLRDLQ